MKKLIAILPIFLSTQVLASMAAPDLVFKNITKDPLRITIQKSSGKILFSCNAQTLNPNSQVTCGFNKSGDFDGQISFQKGEDYCVYRLTGTYDDSTKIFDGDINQYAGFGMKCSSYVKNGAYLVGYSHSYNIANH